MPICKYFILIHFQSQFSHNYYQKFFFLNTKFSLKILKMKKLKDNEKHIIFFLTFICPQVHPIQKKLQTPLQNLNPFQSSPPNWKAIYNQL